jgi:asparagine synthase (glutamine-hydrolysing)
MCGIAGIYFFDEKLNSSASQNKEVISALKHRGPDFQNSFSYPDCTFYHARLSILDLSSESNQPFLNADKTKSLVYNGEIFNYDALAKTLPDIKTKGDAEVLFKLFDSEKTYCLNKLNGFFAFSFYDSQKDELFVVRDRYGEKPLYYYYDNHKLVFASELKALLKQIEKQELNYDSVYTYLRLNYFSGKQTVFKNIFRLLPGEYLSVINKKLSVQTWYNIPKTLDKTDLESTLSDAVKIRLHADVPVGCFLSGGMDSSIIAALAKQQHKDIHTFSVGFKDEPYFDETEYAEIVAKHIQSQHHVFKLSNDDLLENIDPFLNSIDEPFADSSAFNVFVLSKYTKQHVKVALSGDGADELFMGYNKHKAEWLRKKFLYKLAVPLSKPFLPFFPDSRNSELTNKLRQFKRFAKAASLGEMQRFQAWASISNDAEVKALLNKNYNTLSFNNLFKPSFSQKSFNHINLADVKVVLPDDMLVKVDRMSMRHGLEIRSPFMDHRIVEYAMNLSSSQKINDEGQKVILKDTFSHLLPKEIFTRRKKGFELPLWKWLNTALKNDIEQKWLSESALNHNLFQKETVKALKKRVFSSNPGDSPAKIWALIVFQAWYSNYKEFIKEA